MKDIETSLVVQRYLDKKKYESINREGQCSPAKPYGMTFHSNCLTETIFSEQKSIGFLLGEKIRILRLALSVSPHVITKKIICYISL